MQFETYTLTAPSHWASYLINDDCSGMDNDDIEACDSWVNWLGLGAPTDCADEGFVTWHDARKFSPYAADCSTYTFLVAKQEA